MSSPGTDPWDVRIGTAEDVREIERVPIADRLAAHTTFELLERSAARWPDRPAYRYLHEPALASGTASTLSYAQLLGRTISTANFLRSVGVGRRDAVAILMPGGEWSHEVLLGAQTAGIAVPLNYLLEPEQLAGLLRASGARVVVAPGPDVDARTWRIALALRDAVPDVQVSVRIGAGDDQPGVVPLADAAGFSGDRLLFDPPTPSDIAACLHTGGTTGTPKLVPHTHANEIAAAWIDAAAFGFAPGEVVLNGLPLFHVAGVFLALIAFSAGSTVVQLGRNGFREPSTIAALWAIVERERASIMPAVPTVLSRLNQVPIAEHDISTLTHIVCDAAPLPIGVLHEFERITGVPVLECWGMTEATLIVACNPRHGQRRAGSVGIRLPYEDLRVSRVGANGSYAGECAPDEVGVLTINSPTVFPGYLDSAHDAAAWLPEGWLNSGDLGRMDRDGYLWIIGRAKDVIVRGGHKIDPSVIEQPLERHPDVVHCAAVGKPALDVGELPIAYVLLKAGASVSVPELREYAAAHIPERAAVPKEIIVVSELPLSGVGKILKPPLRQDAALRAITELVAGAVPSASVAVQFAEGSGPASVRVTAPGTSPDRRARVASLLAALPVSTELSWTT